MPIERQESWSTAWLKVGFSLTGIGTTLFGCLLPSLSSVWHLDDRRAGILFAAQFTGSALGALLVGKDFFRSVLRGYSLLTTSAALVAFSTGYLRVPMFFAFGLGLGLTMTATSMLIGRTAAGNRGAALSVLNVIWGLGAATSPVIASLWVRRCSPPYLFLLLSAALMMTLLLPATRRVLLVDASDQAPRPLGLGGDQTRVAMFAVIAFLYVGTEASVSGWMMTYVHRLPLSPNAWPAVATTCFWVGLVSGRALVPGLVRLMSEAQLLTYSLLMAFGSILLLLLSHMALAVIVTAALAGLTLAPIFPLCLARVLALMQDSPESKWVFAVSGLGGAVLPWMTGELSAYRGSLRSGLLVAALALAIMIILERAGSDWGVSYLRHSSNSIRPSGEGRKSSG